MATLFAAKHKEQAHCRCCGKKLPKFTLYMDFGPDPDKWPRTREDANRRTNQKIVHYLWSGPKEDRRIARVSLWDGETYRGGYFCTTQCAVDFAFLFAEEGQQTKAHHSATEYQRNQNP